MTETTRPVPTHIGADGRVTAKLTLSPASNTVRAEIQAPPDQAIPIVFVPGIMGSPLLATGDNGRLLGDDNPWAWFPDDGFGWVAGFTRWNSYNRLSPAERKQLLDPAKTRALSNPADADQETVAKNISALPLEEALQRGWGSVMISSYGSVLDFLESRLRSLFTASGEVHPGVLPALPTDPAAWGELKGYQPLTNEQLRAAAEFRFPVYAVGYNWLQSNGQAADYLAERIRAILERCRKEFHLQCEHGVILVTHSMGGLVARMCAKRYPSLIQGVVHGVQPAIGAAAAYRRVRAGWEDLAGMIGLGGTGKKIMPIFANAVGPLELLPNHRYGAGWLRVTFNHQEVFSLPEAKEGVADPYTQIYLERNAWWRLMDPAWINPAPEKDIAGSSQKNERKDWSDYCKRILKAKRFHISLGGYYHPQSFIHYGGDENYSSFHRVQWKLMPTRYSKGQYRSGALPGIPTKSHALALSLVHDSFEGAVQVVNESVERGAPEKSSSAPEISGAGSNYLALLQGQD